MSMRRFATTSAEATGPAMPTTAAQPMCDLMPSATGFIAGSLVLPAHTDPRLDLVLERIVDVPPELVRRHPAGAAWEGHQIHGRRHAQGRGEPQQTRTDGLPDRLGQGARAARRAHEEDARLSDSREKGALAYVRDFRYALRERRARRAPERPRSLWD